MPPLRFSGFGGTVLEPRGSAYLVAIYDGKMRKTVLVRPEHLRMV